MQGTTCDASAACVQPRSVQPSEPQGPQPLHKATHSPHAQNQQRRSLNHWPHLVCACYAQYVSYWQQQIPLHSPTFQPILQCICRMQPCAWPRCRTRHWPGMLAALTTKQLHNYCLFQKARWRQRGAAAGADKQCCCCCCSAITVTAFTTAAAHAARLSSTILSRKDSLSNQARTHTLASKLRHCWQHKLLTTTCGVYPQQHVQSAP
jgi:hypothetical protein